MSAGSPRKKKYTVVVTSGADNSQVDTYKVMALAPLKAKTMIEARLNVQTSFFSVAAVFRGHLDNEICIK